MTEPAKKVVEATSRRMLLSDMFAHGDFLVSRLMQKYPHFNKVNALGYLRTIMDDSRNFCFLINEGGVALFEQQREDLHPQPVVIERFVFAWDESHQAQAALLYRDAFHWAEGIGAREFVVERLTDIPRTLIRKATAPLFTREVAFARIERKT